MKSRFLKFSTLFVCVTTPQLARATDLFWNPTPLTNSWNTSSLFWATASGGAASNAWVNGAVNNAVFDQAGPYTVTVAAPITAGTVIFRGTGTTTFTGTTPNLVTATTVQIDSGSTLDLSAGDTLFKVGSTTLLLNGTFLNGGASGGHLTIVTGSGVLKGGLRWANGSNFAGNIVDNGATKIGLNGNGFNSGTITLSGDNSGATGDFLVASNTLRLASTTALGTSYLRLEGGTSIVELAAGDLARNASATAGGGGINLASSAGFSAISANRTVTLAGGATNILSWGSTAGFSPTTLLFGGANATNTATLVNAINLNGAIRTVQVTNGTAAVAGELSGNLTGTGISGLTKTGTGTLLLSGTNTYAGTTTISAGTLVIPKTASLANYTTAGSTVLTTGTGSMLALNVGGVGEFASTDVDSVLANTTFNSGNLLGLDTTNAGGTFAYNPNIGQTIGVAKSGVGTLVLGGALTYNGATRIDGGTLEFSGGASTLPGAISGVGNLVKSGSADLTLTGASSYTGTTTITGGSFVAKRTTQLALGTGAVSVASGANLTIQDHAGGGQLAYANSFTLAGSGISGSGAVNFYNSGGFDVSGPLAISGGTTVRTDPAVQAASSNVRFTNVISGSGGLTFFAQGGGTGGTPQFTLTGASSYAGDTLLTSSGVNTAPFTVTLSGGNDRLPAGTNLIFGNTPAGSPTGIFNKSTTLALDGISQGFASISNANAGNYRVVGANAIAATLVIINDASAATFDGTIGGVGVNENNLGLTKNGVGTLTLTGANTYTGPTTVTAGTLSLSSATLDDGSAVSVASGAFLNLTHGATDVVGSLILAGISKPIGLYDSTNSGGRITGNGKIQVSGAVTSSYATWASANGIPGEPPLGDFDKDGLANLVEYALGLNPTKSSVPAGTLTGGVLSFTKGAEAKANGDVNFIIEKSADLGISDPWTAVVTQNAPNASDSISYTLPTGQPKVFARLKITQVP